MAIVKAIQKMAGVVGAQYIAPSPSGGDDAASIQAIIDQASADGVGLNRGEYIKVSFPAEEYIISGLEFKSNVWLDFGQAVFKRAGFGVTPISNSMIRTIDGLTGGSYYGKYKNIKVTGGVFDTNGYFCAAQTFRFENVEDGVLEGITIRHTVTTTDGTTQKGNWAFQIGGRRIRGSNLKVLNGSILFQDGVHLTHGDDIQIDSPYVESGDDPIAFGVDFAGNGGVETWDDEALTNVVVNSPVLNATHGSIKVYYGLNTTTNMPFAGNLRGKIDGVKVVGAVGHTGKTANGAVFIVDTTALTFASGPGSAATSGTLSSAYTGASGNYYLIFSNGNTRLGTLTSGLTTVTWVTGLSSVASTSVQVIDPDRIKNIDIDVNMTAGSVNSDGLNANGIYVLGAKNVKVTGTIRVIDTPNGAHAAGGRCSLLLGGEISCKFPDLPSTGPGLSFFDSTDITVHDSLITNGAANRGQIELSGVRNFLAHHNQFVDIQSSSTAVLVQSVGSGIFLNSVTLDTNTATKAVGATTTRFYGQQSGAAQFVTALNLLTNDIRGASNAVAVDAIYNSTGVTPDEGFASGNRGYAAINSDLYGVQALTPGTTIPLPMTVFRGNTLTLTLTQNTTFSTPTGMLPGSKICFILTQDGTGGRTVTWPSNFKFVVAPWVNAAVTTDANKITSITFVYSAGNWYQQAANTWVA